MLQKVQKLKKNPKNLNDLNTKDITDADCAHGKKYCKDFEIKNLGKYYDFISLQWYTIASRCIWKFSKFLSWSNELDPARFFTEPGLSQQVALKKTKVILDVLTDINMLLMQGRG